MAVDTVDTRLGQKAHEQQTVIRLYDPPVDGATPVDGEGNPRTSPCRLSQKAEKLAQGFTEEPVGGTDSDAVTIIEPEPKKKRR